MFEQSGYIKGCVWWVALPFDENKQFTEHGETEIECFWTAVRVRPPPPVNKKGAFELLFYFKNLQP